MHRLFIILLTVLLCGCDGSDPSTVGAADGLPNLQCVDPDMQVWVGGLPHPGLGPSTLERLGIRSVIVVDAPPPVGGTRATVHLPLKYSGIDALEASHLTYLLATMERPIYIHCHHGTNRAPAAAAIGLIGTGELTAEQGLRLLDRSGTNPSFDGLFEAVRTATPIPDDRREPYDGSDATVDDFALSMSDVDEVFARLEGASERGWTDPQSPADAAELVDLLRVSLDRTSLNEDLLFRRLSEGSIERATALEDALVRGDRTESLREMNSLAATCSACHKRFRN
tara:strand:+ start:12215 stop:13063 length:849 start_codon:yes stop_codon:yes gene_type:complete